LETRHNHIYQFYFNNYILWSCFIFVQTSIKCALFYLHSGREQTYTSHVGKSCLRNGRQGKTGESEKKKWPCNVSPTTNTTCHLQRIPRVTCNEHHVSPATNTKCHLQRTLLITYCAFVDATNVECTDCGILKTPLSHVQSHVPSCRRVIVPLCGESRLHLQIKKLATPETHRAP
jgi:hypothetical protein